MPDPQTGLPAIGAAADGGGEGDAHGGWLELLRNRRFLLLEASGALGGAGYAVYSVSVLFLAYDLTGNLAVTGAVLFIEYGAYTCTFLVAPLVDRARNKRSILLVCYPLLAAAAFTLAIALRQGHVSVPLLLGVVAVLSILWDFVWAVYMLAPRLVLSPRQLLVGSGLSSALSVGTQVGGTAVGGALLFLVGPAGGAAAYVVLLVAAAVLSLPLSLPVDEAPQGRFWEIFVDGWKSFRGRAGASLRRFAGLEVVYGYAVALPVLLMPALAHQRFSDPSAVYAVLVTSYAVGGSAAGAVVGHFNPRRSVGALLIGTPALAALAFTLLPRGPGSEAICVALIAVTGAAVSVRVLGEVLLGPGLIPAGSARPGHLQPLPVHRVRRRGCGADRRGRVGRGAALRTGVRGRRRLRSDGRDRRGSTVRPEDGLLNRLPVRGVGEAVLPRRTREREPRGLRGQNERDGGHFRGARRSAATWRGVPVNLVRESTKQSGFPDGSRT